MDTYITTCPLTFSYQCRGRDNQIVRAWPGQPGLHSEILNQYFQRGGRVGQKEGGREGRRNQERKEERKDCKMQKQQLSNQIVCPRHVRVAHRSSHQLTAAGSDRTRSSQSRPQHEQRQDFWSPTLVEDWWQLVASGAGRVRLLSRMPPKATHIHSGTSRQHYVNPKFNVKERTVLGKQSGQGILE